MWLRFISFVNKTLLSRYKIPNKNRVLKSLITIVLLQSGERYCQARHTHRKQQSYVYKSIELNIHIYKSESTHIIQYVFMMIFEALLR